MDSSSILVIRHVLTANRHVSQISLSEWRTLDLGETARYNEINISALAP